MPKISGIKQRRRKRSNTKLEYAHPELRKRLKTEREVIIKLKSLNVNIFEMCPANSNFYNQLSEISQIGSGSFGTIYIAKFKDSPYFIMKEVVLSKEEHLRLEFSRSKSIILKNSFPNEYEVMTLVNNAIYSEAIPNFILTYDVGVCNSCRDNNMCYTTFLEPAIGTMDIIQRYTKRIAVSALIQLLAALYWLHSKFGIYHGDMKFNNVLLLPGQQTGSTNYIINGLTYTANNVGYIFCINDFGLSQIFKPNFTNQNYLGTRNAKVVNNVLVPFTTSNSLDMQTTRSDAIVTPSVNLTWKINNINKQYTYNRFSKNLNPISSIQVDLNDTLSFPPFEFFNDIHNVLGLMVGSYSTSHSYYHLDLPVDLDFKRTISKNIVSEFPYTDDSVRFIRADKMLEYLYPQLRVLDPIIEPVTTEWIVDNISRPRIDIKNVIDQLNDLKI